MLPIFLQLPFGNICFLPFLTSRLFSLIPLSLPYSLSLLPLTPSFSSPSSPSLLCSPHLSYLIPLTFPPSFPSPFLTLSLFSPPHLPQLPFLPLSSSLTIFLSPPSLPTSPSCLVSCAHPKSIEHSASLASPRHASLHLASSRLKTISSLTTKRRGGSEFYGLIVLCATYCG